LTEIELLVGIIMKPKKMLIVIIAEKLLTTASQLNGIGSH